MHERMHGAVALAGATGLSCGATVRAGYGLKARAVMGGQIDIGSSTTLDRCVDIVAREGRVSIGSDCYVGKGCVIVARDTVSIGAGCQIAEHVTIRDQDHKVSDNVSLADREFETAPVVIGDRVWIGAGAVITKGVKIGDGAVIGAGAVVTRDVAAGARAVGMPAREVGTNRG